MRKPENDQETSKNINPPAIKRPSTSFSRRTAIRSAVTSATAQTTLPELKGQAGHSRRRTDPTETEIAPSFSQNFDRFIHNQPPIGDLRVPNGGRRRLVIQNSQNQSSQNHEIDADGVKLPLIDCNRQGSLVMASNNNEQTAGMFILRRAKRINNKNCLGGQEHAIRLSASASDKVVATLGSFKPNTNPIPVKSLLTK